MPERQLEIAEGVGDPHLADVDVARGAQRLRACAPCARHASARPARESSRASPASDIASSVAWPVSVASRIASVKFASARAQDAPVVAWSTATWNSTAGSAPIPAAPRTSSTSARSRAPLVASRR